MILHTIINPYDVLGNTPNNQYCYKKYASGTIIEGTKDENGIKINRVISTNPYDYLNKDYSLGRYFK